MPLGLFGSAHGAALEPVVVVVVVAGRVFVIAVSLVLRLTPQNEAVKGGQTPAAWEKKPAKNRQKDKDARWTKKHGRSFYVSLLKTPKAKEILEFLRHSEF